MEQSSGMSHFTPQASPSLTRRDILKKTLYFSSSMVAGDWTRTAAAEAGKFSSNEPGLDLLAVGDFGSKNESQQIVARQMAAFASTLGRPLDGVLALGDNFYGKMTPDRFDRHFEKMYDSQALNCPFYACIGNHDYETAAYGVKPEPKKYEMQLAYAMGNRTSRWKMPAKWYVLELPNSTAPLVKIIVLDSNTFEGALTPQEKLEQKRFVEAELSKENKAPWLWMMWHHPLFTETSKRADNPGLIRMFGELLLKHPVSFCVSGHDHNLQHLRVGAYPTSFIVSGAGGAKSYDVESKGRGFAKEDLGFNHFHITPTEVTTLFVNGEGEHLHSFRRTLDGRVNILF